MLLGVAIPEPTAAVVEPAAVDPLAAVLSDTCGPDGCALPVVEPQVGLLAEADAGHPEAGLATIAVTAAE